MYGSKVNIIYNRVANVTLPIISSYVNLIRMSYKEKMKRNMKNSLERSPMDRQGAGAPEICVYLDRLLGARVMPLHHTPRTVRENGGGSEREKTMGSQNTL